MDNGFRCFYVKITTYHSFAANSCNSFLFNCFSDFCDILNSLLFPLPWKRNFYFQTELIIFSRGDSLTRYFFVFVAGGYIVVIIYEDNIRMGVDLETDRLSKCEQCKWWGGVAVV